MKNLGKFFKRIPLIGMIGLSTLKMGYSQEKPSFHSKVEGNRIEAWLSDTASEGKNGESWITYIDRGNDKFYEAVGIVEKSKPLKTREDFHFNLDAKTLDYRIVIYSISGGVLQQLVKKEYNEMSQEDAKAIGYDFFRRINEIVDAQNNFSRFNPGKLEKLVEIENDSKIKLINDSLIGNNRIPIRKILSKADIEKIEDYLSPEQIKIREEERIRKINLWKEEKLKEEEAKRERLQQEERARQEKIEEERRLLEMKKLKNSKATLKASAGIIMNKSFQGKGLGWEDTLDEVKGKGALYFSLNPRVDFTNGYNRGVSIGIDYMKSGSKLHISVVRGEEKKSIIETYPATKYYVRDSTAHLSKDIKNSFALGLNIKQIGKGYELFLKWGLLGEKIESVNNYSIKDYIIKNSIIQQNTIETSNHIKEEEYKKSRFYMGMGINLFPFLKKEEANKGVSLDMEILWISGSHINYSYEPVYPVNPPQWAIKLGVGYLFP